MNSNVITFASKNGWSKHDMCLAATIETSVTSYVFAYHADIHAQETPPRTPL